MLAYYHSLERLLDRDDELYLGGHGPLLPAPQTLVRELLGHRQRREAAILRQLEQQDWNVAALAARLYAKTDPFLKIAAQRNVLAHLLKLVAEERAGELEPDTELPPDAPQIPPPPGEVQRESGAAMEMMRDALRRFGLRK